MWQLTSTTADVTVTKIAGYVRVRILMNRRFFRIFGIHSFYATATLLNNIYEYACNEHAADGGCGGGLDFAYRVAGASRRPLLMTTGTRVWTLNPSPYKAACLQHQPIVQNDICYHHCAEKPPVTNHTTLPNSNSSFPRTEQPPAFGMNFQRN